MKKFILSLVVSVGFFFFTEKSGDMLGCGVAPDGITKLGSCFDNTTFSLSLAVFFVVFLFLFILDYFFIKK